MTTPETEAPSYRQPPPPIRPLLRSRDDRVLAGVAGGLGRWLDVDPVIFRVTFGILSLFGGVGIIAYIVGYLLIPDEATGEALVSGRLIPDPRRLTQQQRALIGWGGAGVFVLIAIAGHRSTTVAVLLIVAAVAVIVARAQHPYVPRTPQGPTGAPGFGSAPGTPVPPSTAFTAPATAPPTVPQEQPVREQPGNVWYAAQTWQAPPAWASSPLAQSPVEVTPPPRPQYTVRSRGRRLNRVLISIAVLAVGVYLMLGRAGAYDPTTLQAMAVGLTTLGLGLAATAWYARSRGAMVLGAVLTVLLMLGSALQGDYGSDVGSRVWRPISGAELPATYKLAVGNATLDLTHLGPDAFNHPIKVTMGVGKLRIHLPDGVPYSVYAHVQVGDYELGDQRYSDDPVRQTVYSPGYTAGHGLRVEANLRIGNVEVDHEPVQR